MLKSVSILDKKFIDYRHKHTYKSASFFGITFTRAGSISHGRFIRRPKWLKENEFWTHQSVNKMKIYQSKCVHIAFASTHKTTQAYTHSFTLRSFFLFMLFLKQSNDIGHFILNMVSSNDICIRVRMHVFVWWTYQLFKIWFVVDTLFLQLSNEWSKSNNVCGWNEYEFEKSYCTHTFSISFISLCLFQSRTHIRENLKVQLSHSSRVGFIANVTYCHSLNEHSYLLVLFSTVFFFNTPTRTRISFLFPFSFLVYFLAFHIESGFLLRNL